jgi:decaprenyl-phosphate phosphoribosyltransferase
VADATEGRAILHSIVTSMRPRQWLKNLLVFAAPLAAGAVFEPNVLVPTIGVFVAFCFMASATYLLNDIRDVAADRDHPIKRNRPIAAGHLPVRVAIGVAITLAFFSLALAWRINLPTLAVLAAYAIFTGSYSLLLKHEPVIELALLTMGFLLRAIAGGVAANLPISQWFLIVAGFGSLFGAAGKRYSELERALTHEGGLGPTARRSLIGYTTSYLRFVWGMSAGVTVMAYCLWAFDVSREPSTFAWETWSVLPFVLAVLRYAVNVDRGLAEAPEDVLLHDRVLLVIGGVWLILFGLGAMGV